MTTRIVLVPGFWLGEWAWEAVAPALRDRGFDVVALTLPGLAGDDHGGEVTLADQATAIEEALQGDADSRVLVVHSGAAFPGTLVLDRNPGLVDRFVLVDTAPVRTGTSFNAEQAGDFTLAEAWDGLAEEGSLADLTPEQLEIFRARAVAQPQGIVTEPVVLTDEARHQVPLTVICTTFPSQSYRQGAAQGVPFLAGLLDYADVSYVDLPTGHWPMWSRPTELTGLIAEAAAG
mgnify:CR=1 FL=1